MTDREMLELAAKAAGHEVGENAHIPSGGIWVSDVIGGDWIWNPLGDDGDAMRLANTLNILIGVGMAWTAGSQQYGTAFDGLPESELFPATRRAITRAAAEIGKEMK